MNLGVASNRYRHISISNWRTESSTSSTLPCKTSTPAGAITTLTPLAPVCMPLAPVCMPLAISGIPPCDATISKEGDDDDDDDDDEEEEEEEEEVEEEEGGGQATVCPGRTMEIVLLPVKASLAVSDEGG